MKDFMDRFKLYLITVFSLVFLLALVDFAAWQLGYHDDSAPYTAVQGWEKNLQHAQMGFFGD